jgi:signal transduction histidine kinase
LPSRAKLLLTFAVVSIAPLLIICILGFLNERRVIDAFVLTELHQALNATEKRSDELFRRCDAQIVSTADSKGLHDFVQAASSKSPAPTGDSLSKGPVDRLTTNDHLSQIVENCEFLNSVAVIDASQKLLLVAELTADPSKGATRFTGERLQTLVRETDARDWSGNQPSPLCSVAFDSQLGDLRRCSRPVFLAADHKVNSPRGVLITESRLDLHFADAALESLVPSQAGNGSEPVESLTVVLDSSGRIIYHPNHTLLHQPVGTSEPGWASIAESMTNGGNGVARFKSTIGEDWLATYQPLAMGLSLARAHNLTLARRPARIHLVWSLGLSLLLGLGVAIPLSGFYLRQKRSLERVTRGAAAIAGGELDQKLDLLSRDDLRPLAESVNLMSDRLREQLAREAEEHQFQSFIKLSALLTHDLKNAIGSLSLIVSNMERHFDKPEFRADALRNLAGAADKLRALVTRLSNPVNTLSGEFKRPRPTDLIPLLRQGLARHAEPLDSRFAVEARLPPSLFALGDAERLEKVIENLIINAVEAMSDKGGNLIVSAGQLEGGKVYFSVTDTGPGMSADFIKDRLFRPFATTKQRGVGLGLYTCREVVRASGGSINAESEEGSGTTFRVVLASAS